MSLGNIADNVIHKFIRWRGHTLSLAWRRCMINSVIASSLVQMMMVYKWPKSLLNKIEIAIRCFLWTGEATKKGFSNVEWAKCYAPIDEGGFGIRSIRLTNASFICKFQLDVPTSFDALTCLFKERYFT